MLLALAIMAACNRHAADEAEPYVSAPTTPLEALPPAEDLPIDFPPVFPGSDIHGALHRVTYGDNVAYIFGTIHGGRPYWFPLADVVEDALRRADIIAVEVEEIGGTEAAMQEALAAVTYLPDGQTWYDILPEAHYDYLVTMMWEQWGINYTMVNTMNPSLLVTQLMLQIALMFSDHIDVNFYASVDNYIANVAAQYGIPLVGLESAQQQIDILYNPPFEVMLAQIMHLQAPQTIIDNFLASGELTLDEIAHFYLHNIFEPILHNLALTVYEDCLYLIYMNEVVQNWRSIYYANEIMRLLRDTDEPTTFFVAVGLSHVIRSQAHHSLTDIIQQLQLAGLTPQPIY